MNRTSIVQLLALLTAFLFIFTALSFTVQSAPPVSQETLIVDITGNGDYTTIRDAIKDAAATALIRIKKGIYEEGNLDINKKLTIIGEDPSNTIINCGGKNGFILNSKYVEINNLKFVNFEEYAIYVFTESDTCTLSNLSIEVPDVGVGIWIRSSSVAISDCEIRGNSSGIGIKLRESNNVIKGCNIEGLDVGILALVGAHNNKILQCNFFNNEFALDIRINSYNNIISECNVYGNSIGLKIWQSSNNNTVYLNNFFKNDEDAIDESTNNWDNGIQGNYWDDYTGIDINRDGIGDTPYTIPAGKIDRYPFMTMLLPDVILAPTGVKHITTSWDDIPSFTWNPSMYNKDIRGYYIKIDSNPEVYVGDTTSWTSPSAISDGVHAFYVRAEGDDNTTSRYTTITFLIDTMFIDTDRDGWSDEEEQNYGTDLNDADNYPLDTDNDHIPNSVDTDDDNDGYNDNMESSYMTNTVNLNEYPTDTDNDGVPDNDSPDGKYIGDIDDDDDSLIDAIETRLGSNPKDISDAKRVYISGKTYYLIDISQNGFYEIFYEPTSETITGVEKIDENYLIDQNGDGSWDHIYIVADGSVSAYEEQITVPPVILIIAILIIISTIIILYYIRPKYIEYKKFKKLPARTYTADKDTIEMINETRNLLQHIQQEVTVYMDKLDQIKDQTTVTSSIEKKEETIPLEEKTSELTIHDIEEEVDELLSRSNNKK